VLWQMLVTALGKSGYMHATYARATRGMRDSGLCSGACAQNINWTCGKRRVKVMVITRCPSTHVQHMSPVGVARW